MPIKTRYSPTLGVDGTKRATAFSPWIPYHTDYGFMGVETEISINHASSHGRYLTGGDWTMSRDIYHVSGPFPVNVNNNWTGSAQMYIPIGSVTDLGAPPIPSDSDMDELGTHAISATEPTRPSFDLSVFLGEFASDGMPRLPGLEMREKVARAKSAGGEFLNYEFGWLPLISDVHSFAHAVNNSDTILRNYQEFANIPVKRRYEWPDYSASKFTSVNFGSQPSGLTFSGGGRFQTLLQQKWFEADYVYFLPTGTSVNDKFRRYGSYARKLLGVRMTPEVLWNLAPWSWAVDWFSNCGEVVHNLSALGTDGLVIRNAYVMCHTVNTRRDYGVHQTYGGKTVEHVVESKRRRRANPFGFGLTGFATSLRQKAIIGALGLSRHYP